MYHLITVDEEYVTSFEQKPDINDIKDEMAGSMWDFKAYLFDSYTFMVYVLKWEACEEVDENGEGVTDGAIFTNLTFKEIE